MRPRLIPLVGIIVALSAALGGTGCGPTIRSASSEVPRAATPAVADASLKVLEDERTRQRIAAVLATPEVQQALEEVSAGLTKGAIAGLSDEQMGELIDRAVSRLTHAVVTSVDAAMNELGSRESQAAIQRFASAMTTAIMRSMAVEIPRSLAPALHSALVDELGPAVRESMQKDLVPSLTAALSSPELRDALGVAAREVVRQGVYGSNDALAQLAEQKEHTQKTMPLGTVGQFFATRTWLLVLLLVVAIFAVPFVWLLRERSEARHYRERAERRNAQASALLRAIEASGERPFSPDLMALLRSQFPEIEAEEREREEQRPPPPGAPTPRPA